MNERAVYDALDVLDAERPAADLGFVRSVVVDEADVEVHLQLPESYGDPDVAYLMAAEAQDALSALPWTERVVVEVDHHHDDDDDQDDHRSLDEHREAFRRRAHAAARERCLVALLRAEPDWTVDMLGFVRLGDLPSGPQTDSLLRRRAAIGLGTGQTAPVLVDHTGRRYHPDDVPTALRRVRSPRPPVDGDGHFYLLDRTNAG
jgi:metal-sulfur cluster biosynthetic enzyme